MNKYRKWGLLMAVLTISMTVTAASPSSAARNGSSSVSDVVTFADDETPVGSSQLVRTQRGVVATFRSSQLQTSEALTLWWVVFNTPAGCSGPCGENDIFLNGDPAQGLNQEGIAAADIVAGYATGVVSNSQGHAIMQASLRTGAAVDEIIFGDGPILKDQHAAEIHLVARSHGPAVSGLIDVQTGSFAGGCEVFLIPPNQPEAAGECGDIQFAVHLP